MASLGHTRAVAHVFGVRLTGFPAWWIRRTYYLFQMPRWDRRLRIVLDWTVALFFKPDITKVELRAEQTEYMNGPQAHVEADCGLRQHARDDSISERAVWPDATALLAHLVLLRVVQARSIKNISGIFAAGEIRVLVGHRIPLSTTVFRRPSLAT